MNQDNIFNNYTLIEDNLIEYGFELKRNKYIYSKDINKSLFVSFIITKTTFTIKVFDKTDNEEFLPFTIKQATGEYVSTIRDKVELIKNDILDKCFIKDNLKQQILEYVKKKENTVIDYPWQKNPTYCTIKYNKKWYGLIMDIPAKTLGLDSDDIVNVMNLKNKPEIIDKLIDNKNFFRAYHMNKKHWYTVIINRNISIDKIKQLLDESYNEIIK